MVSLPVLHLPTSWPQVLPVPTALSSHIQQWAHCTRQGSVRRCFGSVDVVGPWSLQLSGPFI
jgi:hypothetical protein